MGIPESLKYFLQLLIPSSIKRSSIGQCFVQGSRPRTVISPILFGVGVQMDKSFGSKWLVNQLSRLGFSITSEEVLRFKQSAVENAANTDEEEVQGRQGAFVQWVADNVDHNIATLTGKGTFHGMGIISISDVYTIA